MDKTQTRTFPSRTLRRNRAFLGVGVAVAGVMGVVMTGVLDRQPHAAPMLMVVDEMPVRSSVQVFDRDAAMLPTRPAVDEGFETAAGSAALDEISDVRVAEVETSAGEVVASQEGDDLIRWFNGRPVRAVRTMVMVVTAYSPDERSCGDSADGITASGYSVWTNGMKMVAADTDVLPFGSLITVPGYDHDGVVPVLDRGGAIKGKRLDVLYPTHEQARRWGVQRLEVTVWEYADGRPNDFKTAHAPVRVASN